MGLDRQTLSGPSLFFMTMSASAPLTGVAGGIVAGYSYGVTGIPAGFILVTAAWALFSVGYVAMARHVPHAGPFFAQVARGLGPAPGVAAAAVALLAYNAIICCLFGLLGATMSGYLGGPWWAWALAAWAVVAVLGLVHVRLSAALLKVLLAVEVTVVIAFDAVGLTHPAGGRLDLAPLSPAQITAASAGVGVAFIVACFIGVETVAAYAEESRSYRILVRASFAALLTLGVLFAVSAWAIVAVVGAEGLRDVTAEVFFTTLDRHLGLFALVLARLLLVTSILAAVISVHQTVSRYVFGLSREGLLPHGWGRVRSGHGVPVGGSAAQSATGLAVIVVWAVVGAGPMVLFSWLAALAAVGIMALMIASCGATMRFFRRGGGGRESAFTRIVAPLAGMVTLVALLAVTVSNLRVLVGAAPDSTEVWFLPALVVLTGVVGLVWAWVATRRYPGLLLGRGEPEPLAVLEHNLVGVDI